MPVFVDDYTALLSGSYWNGGALGRGAFLTYSFDLVPAAYLTGTQPAPFLASFQAFSPTDQSLTRQIMEAYAAACGLTIFEVPAGQGDIRFGKYDLTLSTAHSRSVGFASLPGTSLESGDVYIHAPSINPVLLSHEVGHALGLKHPYDGEVQLSAASLRPELTIFVGGVAGGANIGPAAFDRQALAHVYGGPAGDGNQVMSWSWDPVSFRLTQTGSAGADTVMGVGVADIISGQSGDDSLNGRDGADTLEGGDGNDTVQGGEGANAIRGGAGDDSLTASEDSVLIDGGEGVDRLTLGGFGNIGRHIDVAAFFASGALIGVEFVGVSGGAAADTIVGSAAADTISGNGGADQIRAGGGDDQITLSVTPATAGLVLVDGGPGSDRLNVFTAQLSGVSLSVAGLPGLTNVEAITLVGTQGSDTLVGSSASDGVSGSSGDDLLIPGDGADSIFGGDGVDTVDFSGESAALSLTVNVSRNLSPGVFEFMSGVENVIGTAFGDVIRGDAASNGLFGRGGADTLSGGEGQNYVRGDDGDDSLVGGATFDDINGNMGADTVSTGAGEDYCVGGKDNDSLSGGADYDLVYGNLGADTCDGGDGDDVVRGGQDNDVVQGGAGDDFVSGDKGDDTMSGGAGADRFHTFGDAGLDRVIDFSLAEGDRVQLDPGTQFTVAQAGADTVISMTGGGQMVLVGVQMSTLSPGWIFGA